MNAPTDGETLRRTQQAKDELQLVGEAFEGIRQALIRRWLETTLDQTALREKLHTAAQTITAVEKALMGAVAAGEVANYSIALAEQGLTRP